MDRRISPMLCASGPAFDSADHLFDIKWDGFRMLAFAGRDRVRLQSRKLTDETARYREIVAALQKLPGELVLDGEVVVFHDGKPSFERVLRRRSQSLPATYVAFDLLYADGTPLLEAPLSERKKLLHELLRDRASDALIESAYAVEHGRAYFQEVVARGLEGVVAKALSSPYLPGKRTRHWVKSKAERIIDCVVLGTLVESGTERVRSLVLGAYRDGSLVWMGNVGSGLDESTLRKLATELAPLAAEAPQGLKVEGAKNVRWLRPALVARVKYLETTGQGRLRAPVFLGFVDRSPDACTTP